MGGGLGVAEEKRGRAGSGEDVDDGDGEDGAEYQLAKEGAMRHGAGREGSARPVEGQGGNDGGREGQRGTERETGSERVRRVLKDSGWSGGRCHRRRVGAGGWTVGWGVSRK